MQPSHSHLPAMLSAALSLALWGCSGGSTEVVGSGAQADHAAEGTARSVPKAELRSQLGSETKALDTVMPPSIRAPLSESVDASTPPNDQTAPQQTNRSKSTVQAALRQRVSTSRGSWSVSQTTNPEGSFILLRNTSDPAVAGAAIDVVFGDDRRMLDSRQTATWPCEPTKGADGEGTSLKVDTDAGDTILQASLRCGDAVYIGLRAATLEGGSALR